MGFQDVVFPPFRASFSQLFIKIVMEVKAKGTTICLTAVVGHKQGHATCKIPLPQQSLIFCVSSIS